MTAVKVAKPIFKSNEMSLELIITRTHTHTHTPKKTLIEEQKLPGDVHALVVKTLFLIDCKVCISTGREKNEDGGRRHEAVDARETGVRACDCT